MSIQIRPTTVRNGASALRIIEDTLQAAGAKMPKYREITNARKIVDRGAAIAAQFQEIVGSTTTTYNESLAEQILDDSVPVAQAIVAAAQAEASRGAAAGALRDLVKRKTASRAGAELAKVGDKWITEVFRPLIDPIVAELEGMTDLLDKCGPRGPMSSHENRETRDRWTRANDLAEDLEALHTAVDHLRNAGIIPAGNRDVSAEYRWANLDRLGSLSTEVLPILASIRNGARAGIYTEAETVKHVTEAEERREAERRSRPGLFAGAAGF